MAAFDSTVFPGSASQELSASDANWAKITGYSDDGRVGNDGNYAYVGEGLTTAYRRAVTPPSANYTVTATIALRNTAGSTFRAGVMGRVNSSTGANYWWRYRHDTNVVELVSSGAGGVLGTYSMTLTTTPVVIQLRMDDDQISGYVDGVLRVGPVTNADHSAAGFGGIYLQDMRLTGNYDTASLDNYEAEEIGGGGSFAGAAAHYYRQLA